MIPDMIHTPYIACGICLSIAGQQTTLDELPECPQTLRGRTDRKSVV